MQYSTFICLPKQDTPCLDLIRTSSRNLGGLQVGEIEQPQADTGERFETLPEDGLKTGIVPSQELPLRMQCHQEGLVDY